MSAARALTAALLAAGAVLRIWGTEHAQVNFDQTWFWTVALDIVEGRAFPRYGSLISGTEARVPSPLFHYLCALPHLVTRHPRAGGLFFALLHVGAGFLLHRVCARAAGAAAGLTALALWAFNPWQVLYAHSLWLSNIAPPYGVAIVAAAFAAQRSAVAQGLLATLVLAGPALHLSLPTAWVSALTVLALRPPQRVSGRAIAIGLAIGLSFFAPSLVAELGSGFANTRAIFEKALGEPPPGGPLRSAAQVPMQALVFASSEMGYWFARGYWGGGFDALDAYGTPAAFIPGVSRRSGTNDVLTTLSLLLALGGWGFALASTGRELRAALRQRTGLAALSDAAVIVLATVAGLLVSAALLFSGKKLFFPHYVTAFAPLCLFPPAWAMAVVARRTRAVPAVLVGLVATSMLANTLRYYREVESLNGLGSVLGIVGDLVKEGAPFTVRFRHVANDYAFGAIAERWYGRPLRLSTEPEVVYTVDNDAPRPFVGGPSPDGRALDGAARPFGLAPVWLERHVVARPRPPGLLLSAREAWRQARVELLRPGDDPSPCAPAGSACAYGSNPWERFGPEDLEMAGAPRRVVFMHPVSGSRVRATFPLPEGATRGVLAFGLSDAATRSGNTSPVEVALLRGEAILARSRAVNDAPGLHTLPFTVTATGARTLAVEVATVNDGARVFGFELEVFGD